MSWRDVPIDRDLWDSITGLHEPRRVGQGEDQFSTCVALVLPFHMVWDNNRYYADLGVPVTATKAEVRKHAYQELDGPSSVRLTMIARTLLDAEKRADYDSTPLGVPYVDADIEWAFHLLMVAKKTQAMIDAHARGDDVHWTGQQFDRTIDADMQTWQDRKVQSTLRPDRGWAYWQVRTTCEDVSRIQLWQGLLVGAASAQGFVTKIAVGFVGSPGVEVQEHQGRVLVLLGESEIPNTWIAVEAICRARDLVPDFI